MLFAYSVVIGYGLLSGSISADSAFLLIAIACMVPAFAGLYGFVTNADRDWGLLLGALGWTSAALALVIQQGIQSSAQSAARPGELVVPPDTSPATIIFGFVAFVLLLASAVVGYQNWSTSVEFRGS